VRCGADEAVRGDRPRGAGHPVAAPNSRAGADASRSRPTSASRTADVMRMDAAIRQICAPVEYAPRDRATRPRYRCRARDTRVPWTMAGTGTNDGDDWPKRNPRRRRHVDSVWAQPVLAIASPSARPLSNAVVEFSSCAAGAARPAHAAVLGRLYFSPNGPCIALPAGACPPYFTAARQSRRTSAAKAVSAAAVSAAASPPPAPRSRARGSRA
jgi:hypothetical protein